LPRLASGPYSRTRRPRPSEKIIFRAISGLSPQGHPSLDGPPRGGAGSARPQTRLCLHREIAPLGHRAFVCPRCLCYAPARIRPCHAGARSASLREDRLPPHLRAFPVRPFHLRLAPRGGAGSARPQGWHHANPNVAFFGHHALANEPVTVTCPGLRPARIRGRGDRVPPRKSSLAPSPAFPRKAIPAWMAHPWRGGLRTPAMSA
jgi:hypothetical protein